MYRLPWWLGAQESACQCRRCRFDLRVGKIPWRRKWHPTPVFLPGRFHGQGTLMGFSPWGRRESGQLSTQCLGFPGGSVVNPPASAGVRVQPLGREDPLEEEMATHSSIPAWRIHSQRSPGSYLPMGSRESDTTWQLNHHHHI